MKTLEIRPFYRFQPPGVKPNSLRPSVYPPVVTRVLPVQFAVHEPGIELFGEKTLFMDLVIVVAGFNLKRAAQIPEVVFL